MMLSGAVGLLRQYWWRSGYKIGRSVCSGLLPSAGVGDVGMAGPAERADDDVRSEARFAGACPVRVWFASS
jgi:hypothetical protein